MSVFNSLFQHAVDKSTVLEYVPYNEADLKLSQVANQLMFS